MIEMLKMLCGLARHQAAAAANTDCPTASSLALARLAHTLGVIEGNVGPVRGGRGAVSALRCAADRAIGTAVTPARAALLRRSVDAALGPNPDPALAIKLIAEFDIEGGPPVITRPPP